MATVVCNTCNSEYEALYELTDQGADCSAHADDSGVVGHYGSTLVDMEEWVWATGKPLHVKDGMICDACIKLMQTSGALVFKRNYWG